MYFIYMDKEAKYCMIYCSTDPSINAIFNLYVIKFTVTQSLWQLSELFGD